MKKTILLVGLLGGVSLAATPKLEFEDYDDPYTTIYDNMAGMYIDADFAISYRIEGLNKDKFSWPAGETLDWLLQDNHTITLSLYEVHELSGGPERVSMVGASYTESGWVLWHRYFEPFSTGPSTITQSSVIETQIALDGPGTCVLQYTQADKQFSFHYFDEANSSYDLIASLDCSECYFPETQHSSNYFTLNNAATWNNDATNVTIWSGVVTASDLVPEPATGTLSLLALAGLAARRRRK